MNVEASVDVISTIITTTYTKAINAIYDFIIYNFTIYIFIIYIISDVPHSTIFLVIIFVDIKPKLHVKPNNPKN